MATILVVDDEETICFAFQQFLLEKGHDPLIASTAEDGLDIIRGRKPQIVFLDIRLPGLDGLSMLRRVHSISPDTKVVIMTAHGSMDTAVEAMHNGAYDYLPKPIDLDATSELIERMLRHKVADDVCLADQEGSADNYETNTLIGSSRAIQDIYKMIGLLTNKDVPVLIEGESGVGKELVAQAIHSKGDRCNRPFVALNCAAMPATLLETELFGHEKGSFTGADDKKIGKFEFAGQGTIFLDEIGDLEFPLQIKLLRVLQEKKMERVGGLKSIPVQARMIAATNKNLAQEVKAGRVRSDLYYRLQLITLNIPPLRERREDISDLVAYFIQKANLELDKKIRGIESDAMERLIAYDWPGNVRELENVIKRAAILTRGDTIGLHRIEPLGADRQDSQRLDSQASIERIVRQWFTQRNTSAFLSEGELFGNITATVEKTLIREALKACGQNQVGASKLLGMNRTTLRKKIASYDLK
jgi:DNA-binding NtrC family response regulator